MLYLEWATTPNWYKSIIILWSLDLLSWWQVIWFKQCHEHKTTEFISPASQYTVVVKMFVPNALVKVAMKIWVRPSVCLAVHQFVYNIYIRFWYISNTTWTTTTTCLWFWILKSDLRHEKRKVRPAGMKRESDDSVAWSAFCIRTESHRTLGIRPY